MKNEMEEKRLNILAMDGGGCQGISNLLILDDLVKSIAKQRGLKSNQTLRPCDIFDVICGVGSGGWLAFLLGRLKLSISECMYEYCNIAKAIVRPDTLKAKWNHHIQYSVHDIGQLLKYVEHLTRKYKVGDRLLAENTDGVRCELTFAVASYQAQSNPNPGHCLFRTYNPEGQDSGMSPDPATTRISEAFAATGAKKGLLYPFKMELGGSPVEFGNENGKFPNCLTNATMFALDEVARVYGEQSGQVRISTVVNIGPGVPGTQDIRKISSLVSRRSWGSINSRSSNTSKGSKTTGTSKSSNSLKSTPNHNRRCRLLLRVSHYFKSQPKPTEIRQQLKASQLDKFREIDQRVNSDDDQALYMRLGPEDAPENTAISDVVGTAPDQAQEKAVEYLKEEEIQKRIAILTKRITAEKEADSEGIA